MARSEKGKAFQRYCEQSGMRYVEIAERLKLSNPQNITHWKVRGVPARHAVRVATLLGCNPNEISEIVINDAKADEYTNYAARKREARDIAWQIIDEIDDPRILDLLVEQVRGIHKAFSK